MSTDILLRLCQIRHPRREGEPVRGCGPEAQEFRPEAWSAGGRQVLEHHREDELSASGNSLSADTCRNTWSLKLHFAGPHFDTATLLVSLQIGAGDTHGKWLLH